LFLGRSINEKKILFSQRPSEISFS
jgi:hypothetical protein